MEIKLIGNDTTEKELNDLKEKLEQLEEETSKAKKAEILEMIKDFVASVKDLLGRDLSLEDRVRVVSTAGQLSREKGTVLDVYNRRTNAEKNENLAKKVIGYGHKTISEHDYLVFALQDVSRIVEQTLIGYRLTSFTIKSGRNVDFRTAGFYVPDFRDKDGNILPNNDELKEIYTNYMSKIFTKYGEYIDAGVPVEEARYTLPFGLKTNIVMGCDAHEFLTMTCDLLYGKQSKISELHELGLQFEQIIREKCPYLVPSLEAEVKKKKYENNLAFLDDYKTRINNHGELDWYDPSLDYRDELLDKVNLINCSSNSDYIVACHIIKDYYRCSYEMAEELLYRLVKLGTSKEEIIRGTYLNRDQRALEQVSYTFEFPIALSVLPQFTRHRIQSPEIPDFYPLWNVRNHLYPIHDEDNNAHIDKDEYDELFENNALLMEQFRSSGVRDEDLIYFYLGGNACNVTTTMNARELIWFSRMRSCNKAQRPIREISQQMCAEVDKKSPLIGSLLGPTCKVDGICPEGSDSCRLRGVVVLKKEKND